MPWSGRGTRDNGSRCASGLVCNAIRRRIHHPRIALVNRHCRSDPVRDRASRDECCIPMKGDRNTVKTYQTDGKWFAVTDGGMHGGDEIPGMTLEMPEKPKATAKWTTGWVSAQYQGKERKIFTNFEAGEVAFTLVRYDFDNAQGYSFYAEWEVFEQPQIPAPVLGDAFRWTTTGWEQIPHPMMVE